MQTLSAIAPLPTPPSGASLEQLDFVDLYLCDRFIDYKAHGVGAGLRRPLSEALVASAKALLAQCKTRQGETKQSEFLLIFQTLRLRVTYFGDALGGALFVLRRIAPEVSSLSVLGVPPPIQRLLRAPELRGLVLIAGEMSQGKTSTAASILTERLRAHGGVAVAIEDPPEAMLDGLHGDGRCIQVAATAENGGYRQQLVHALRSGADALLIGEIRDPGTAQEVLNACINGHLIISTLHAGDICQAVERLNVLCQAHYAEANAVLASGLSVVICQSLQTGAPGADGHPGRAFLKMECLTMTTSARARVRAGEISHLLHEVDQQMRQLTWGPAEKRSFKTDAQEPLKNKYFRKP